MRASGGIYIMMLHYDFCDCFGKKCNPSTSAGAGDEKAIRRESRDVPV